MNSKLWKTTFWAGCLAAAGLSAWGGPLQRSDVPAGPAWLAHVNVDRLRSTVIGRFILAELDKPEARVKLAAFQTIFSFDPRKQLHGLTLYSAGAAPQDGVLVVSADFDAERLVTLAKAAKEAEHTPYKQHIIYSWLDEKKAKNGVKPRVYAAIDGARVVFGQREECVARALDVLDGAVPSLATSRAFPQLGAAGDASFLEGAARKLELPTSDPNAAILRLSKRGRFQFSERQGRVLGTLVLEANDEGIAGHIASIGQGLIALMKLQAGRPEAVKLADALSLKQEGPQVVVNLTLPANEAVELIRADAARKAKKRAAKAEKD